MLRIAGHEDRPAQFLNGNVIISRRQKAVSVKIRDMHSLSGRPY
jgi:hypothetical protein